MTVSARKIMGHPNVREALKSLFPKSKKWHIKIDRMTDSQTVAVYFRLFQERKFKEKT